MGGLTGKGFNEGENRTNAGGDVKKTPARYKLYDKIRLRVSLRTMDIIIWVVVALLVILVLAGTIIK